MASITSRDLQTFRSELTGTVVTPDDPTYAEARAAAVWNGDIQRRPALIARCSGPGDVATALRFARNNGLEVTVRGGGHNFAGFAVCDDGLMIDLGALNQVTVDPAGRRAVCGGGATWGDVDAATQAHGLAVPGGLVSTTGIGGLTLGGGIGWLSRKHGLTADNLLAAEVVTADGSLVRASADEHPDLFWALRGGGGNFGVVTSFEYRLHPVGPQVHLGLFFWGVDQGTAALRFCRDYLQTVPEDAGAFLAGLSAPPEPFVPEPYHHAPGYALVIVGFGSAEDHARVVAPIRETVSPAFELVTSLPYTALQQMFNAGTPWGILGYEKALYLDALSDDVIDVFTTYLPQKRSLLTQVPVFAMGGAYRRVGEAETAFGGSRSAGFVFNIAAFCPTPELLTADRAWVRAFWSALLPFASNPGGYLNFMAEYEENRVRAAYGAAKYERLARIKAQYDPENVFRHNANIKPALQPV
jgi:FAD/FMN-containing dehydrogenase